MIKIAAPLMLSTGLGFALTCLGWPRQRRLLQDLPLMISLSAGLGLGISSLVFFLWLSARGPNGSGLALFEAGFALIVSLFAIARRRQKTSDAPRAGPPVAQSRTTRSWEWISGVVFLLTLAAAAGAFAWFTRAGSSGGWDAWGIWNLRAKFLFLGGDHWRDAFSAADSLSHTDYPLLVPLSVARGWSYAGSDVQRVPILTGAMFTAATVGLLLSSLWILRGRSQGLVAATLLAASPFFVVLGTAQYADVPLAFLYLATLVLLCLHKQAASKALLALAGATAGLAAWTKNEGLLFLVCLGVAWLSTLVRRSQKPPFLPRQWMPFAMGLVPVLGFVIWFKLNLAGHSDLFSSATMTLKMLGRISRWRVVAKAFADQLLHFGGWAIPLTPFLAFYLLVAGVDRGQIGVSSKICLRALCLTFLGYLLVYIITPLPLAWHLETSLNRVLTQLWPSALFLLFLVTKPLNSPVNQTGGSSVV